MKLVIVEDEQNIREGLTDLIRTYTDHEIAGEARNGQEGEQMVQELLPDCVISDIRMPVMDGITMMEHLRGRGFKGHFVLLTGYSDFEYARRAMVAGCDDYLLKPVSMKELVRVLDEVDGKIERSTQEIVSEEQLMYTAFMGAPAEQEKSLAQLKKRLFLMDGQPVSIFLVKNGSHMLDVTGQMEVAAEDALRMTALQRSRVFRIPGNMLLIIIMDIMGEGYLKGIYSRCISPELNKLGRCMAACREISDISELPGNISEMRGWFECGFSLPADAVIDETLVREMEYHEREYPSYLEQNACRALRSGKRERVQQLQDEFCSTVIMSDARPQVIREYTNRFLLALVKAGEDVLPMQLVEELYHSFLDSIARSETLDALLYEYDKVFERLLMSDEAENATANSLILTVVDMIRTRFGTGITLTEAAAGVGITPEYLSKLFVQEMGMNFSTFLNSYRIREARRLLMNKNQKISDVAEAVGFRDVKYFNRVFKATVGVTPSDFRRNQG